MDEYLSCEFQDNFATLVLPNVSNQKLLVFSKLSQILTLILMVINESKSNNMICFGVKMSTKNRTAFENTVFWKF